ncbi:hypothetical protein TNCV_2299311 [Trichonephila clavipes]|nr:hypothetical protein TNCV_2299311 [Trichonephila clavipes]
MSVLSKQSASGFEKEAEVERNRDGRRQSINRATVHLIEHSLRCGAEAECVGSVHESLEYSNTGLQITRSLRTCISGFYVKKGVRVIRRICVEARYTPDFTTWRVTEDFWRLWARSLSEREADPLLTECTFSLLVVTEIKENWDK